MSKLHVGTNVDSDTWNVVIHDVAPVGNNSAGFTWISALLSSGASGVTVMAEGTGTGEISTAEKAAVEAGTTLELATQLVVQPPYAVGDWNAAVNTKWAEYTTELQR